LSKAARDADGRSDNPKQYILDPSKSLELAKDVFRNTAASAYPLARVQIGSGAEVGRKHNRM